MPRQKLSGILAMLFVFLCCGWSTYAEEWSARQEEVWKAVEAYTQASHQRDVEKYLSFWHDDFLGWYDGHSALTSKEQRKKGLEKYFLRTKSREYELEPLAVQVVAGGKAAIVHYIIRNVLEDTSTGEKTKGTAYWTDYLVKEKGRWLLISDHGGSGPDN